MIALGNNTYRTLDDKFYLGNTQIGKVYLGNTLIYPEEQIIIGGITIDTNYHSLDGYVYDIGYSSTKNTRFECCFIPDSQNSRGFFGTQHDNKFTPSYTYYLSQDNQSRGTKVGTSESYDNYNVNVLLNSGDVQYTTIQKNSSSWNSLIANNPNGYKNYNNYTKFSLVKGNNLFSFRYGGEADAGSKGENNISASIQIKKPYVIGFDDINNNKRVYAKAGSLGKYYYILNNEQIPQDIQTVINNAQVLDNTSVFSDSANSGNIWINGINARIANPNIRRPYDSLNHTLDDDIIYYIESGNIGFIYMIIWESGNNAKTLYTQHYDQNTNKVLIYKYIQVSDGQGGWKFQDADPNTGEVPVDEIIYPFYRCIPV